MTRMGSPRGLFVATVLNNQPVCRDHFRLLLLVPGLPPPLPGQFVQLSCDPPREQADEPDQHDWLTADDPGVRSQSLVAPVPLLRRPISLAGAWTQRPGDTGILPVPEAIGRDARVASTIVLDLIIRRIGLGTTRLGELKPGAQITLLGPLGNAFPPPDPGQTAILVGGGVGIPPMIYLASSLARAGVPTVAVCGVLTADLLPVAIVPEHPPDRSGEPAMCLRDFAELGVPAIVTSDDGSVGLHGRATDALLRLLEKTGVSPANTVIYTCGPEVMMRAVIHASMMRDIRVWVAMERAMACGIGTCQSCVCRTQKPGEREWKYRLVCTDGPVFDGREIVWE